MTEDRITPMSRRVLMIAPIAIIVTFGALLLVPATHDATLALLDENAPVEFLTFVFGLWAATEAVKLAVRLGCRGESFAAVFYVAFGALMFFLGMEEIGWGQQFLGFPTPAFWKPYNAQGETTLHNLKGIAKYLETMPLGYGVVALIGLFGARALGFPEAVWPSRLLLPWFLVITAHSAIDLMHEFWVPSETLDGLVNDLDELSEMLVALSGVCYVRLNAKTAAAHVLEPARELHDRVA